MVCIDQLYVLFLPQIYSKNELKPAECQTWQQPFAILCYSLGVLFLISTIFNNLKHFCRLSKEHFAHFSPQLQLIIVYQCYSWQNIE